MAASMTYNICSVIFRATGNSKTPLYFLLIANAFNIILDIVLIAVFKWGVVGAALATLIAQVLSAILVLLALELSILVQSKTQGFLFGNLATLPHQHIFQLDDHKQRFFSSVKGGEAVHLPLTQ